MRGFFLIAFLIVNLVLVLSQDLEEDFILEPVETTEEPIIIKTTAAKATTENSTTPEPIVIKTTAGIITTAKSNITDEPITTSAPIVKTTSVAELSTADEENDELGEEDPITEPITDEPIIDEDPITETVEIILED